MAVGYIAASPPIDFEEVSSLRTASEIQDLHSYRTSYASQQLRGKGLLVPTPYAQKACYVGKSHENLNAEAGEKRESARFLRVFWILEIVAEGIPMKSLRLEGQVYQMENFVQIYYGIH